MSNRICPGMQWSYTKEVRDVPVGVSPEGERVCSVCEEESESEPDPAALSDVEQSENGSRSKTVRLLDRFGYFAINLVLVAGCVSLVASGVIFIMGLVKVGMIIYAGL